MALVDSLEITMSDDDFRRVSDLIYSHCGINLHEGKRSLVRARLAKRIREGNFASFGAYIDYAESEQGEKEFTNLVDAISTNLTSFFREDSHYQYLREVFLPDLMARKSQSKERRIRAWSAGCSSGEEPYSMAITLLEETEKRGKWDIRILASDVSTRMLDRASAGSYDAEQIAPLNQQQRSRFLSANRIYGKKVYQVSAALQNMIRFRYLNLMNEWPFQGPFDVIFCRNVMIYFDKPTKEKLINRFWDCLASGGLLCIGHSESLTGTEHKFRYVQPVTYMKP